MIKKIGRSELGTINLLLLIINHINHKFEGKTIGLLMYEIASWENIIGSKIANKPSGIVVASARDLGESMSLLVYAEATVHADSPKT